MRCLVQKVSDFCNVNICRLRFFRCYRFGFENCVMLSCLHKVFVDKGSMVLLTLSHFSLHLHHLQTHVNIQTHATRHT